MSQENETDHDGKREREMPSRSPEDGSKNDHSRDPGHRQSNPMRLFETARTTPKPNRYEKAWGEVEIVPTLMQERSTGRVPSPEEVKAAESDIKKVLATHFPEGPKGAVRAQRQFVRWLDGVGAEQTPGTARWLAACRDIGRLEDDPAKPNYLVEVNPVDGIDFSRVGRGLDLRDRIAAHAKAKAWSSLRWSTTQDGGLILSRSGQPIARLEPDRGENAVHAGADENPYRAVTKGTDKAATFGTMHEGKAFLEHWAMGEFKEASRSADARHKEQYASRNIERRSSDGRDR